jgi:hypothetical protein
MEKKNSTPADIEPVKIGKKLAIPVHQYTLEGKYIKTFYSIADAQKAMNPHAISVYRAVNGKAHSAYGFQWRKAE